MRVAVVGSGIAGLAAAHTLQTEGAGAYHVTLLEAADYFGGHTHTVDVTLPTATGPVTHGVDTGFLVFNERTYPELIALFESLGIQTAKSDMSFSVQFKPSGSERTLEWSGTSLGAVFAQRRNLLNWRFLRMLRELLRFNALCTHLASSGSEAQLRQTLGTFLTQHRFSQEFRDWYFLPMIACIWSCPTAQMLQFPVDTLIRFCHNHGLLQISNRPQWWTVSGGARQYVDAITAQIADKRLAASVTAVERLTDQPGRKSAGQVRITINGTTESFDKVILATHADQALALLQKPTQAETDTLGAFRFQPNRAVLHTDTAVLPTRQTAWAAWNHEHAPASPAAPPHLEHAPSTGPASPAVCLHYLINRLQPLPWTQSVVVSLNPLRPIAPQHVLGEYAYTHPVFDAAAMKAQRRIPWLQGQQNTYFCGAWMGYGFHEDGLKAGVAAARHAMGRSMDAVATPAGARP
jgi:uncharacterized protein